MNIPDDIQKRVADEFARRYPEFHTSPHNAKVLRETVEQCTDAGANFSVDLISSCNHHLQAAGALQQEEPKVAELSWEEKVRQKDIADTAKYADNMDDRQLESRLRGAGMYVPRTSTMY